MTPRLLSSRSTPGHIQKREMAKHSKSQTLWWPLLLWSRSYIMHTHSAKLITDIHCDDHDYCLVGLTSCTHIVPNISQTLWLPRLLSSRSFNMHTHCAQQITDIVTTQTSAKSVYSWPPSKRELASHSKSHTLWWPRLLSSRSLNLHTHRAHHITDIVMTQTSVKSVP